MIFKDTHRYVLDSTKTQTRRLKKSGDYIHVIGPLFQEVIRNGRLLWRVGRTYAIQPSRGKKAVGRIVLNAIRKEQLQDISAEDCIAEGLISHHREHAAVADLKQQFKMLWNGIHTLKGQRWNDNPEVWILEFDLVR